MKRVFTLTGALLFMFVLQACNTQATTQAQTEEKNAVTTNDSTNSVKGKNAADNPTVSHNTQVEGNQHTTAFSIVYQDNYRTVYQMNKLQLSALSGYVIDNASIQNIIQSFQQEDTWLAQQFSNDDATLIANAAMNEAKSIQHTLEKILQNQATDLQLVVYHSQYRQTAHFGTNNNNNHTGDETDHDGSATTASSTQTQADQHQQTKAITIAYQDNYRTVYLMNKLQLSTISGYAVDNASKQNILQLLQQEDTWLAQQFSNEDAVLIAKSASNEATSIQHTLEKIIQNQAIELRLVVFHSQYRSTAHFGTQDN